MKRYLCNPLNLPYRYQFNEKLGGCSLSREAADPSLVLFKGVYYLFPSMTDGFFASEDLATWTQYPLEGMPVYDYAPDVRAVGQFLYFCASRRGKVCDFYRTEDPRTGKFERIPGSFDFWDPDLFCDDDGRLYFYWGCSNVTPIWGVELDPETMQKKGEPIALIDGRMDELGYERIGENHRGDAGSGSIEQILREQAAKKMGCRPEDIQDLAPLVAALPAQYQATVRRMLSGAPFIEGAWMTKHDGRYYLQYAAPGTQYNIYCDAVYVADAPLGPFTLARSNPYSYMPGGFCPGAGHGSTLQDKEGTWWHTSTMRISVNHQYERRLGLWPAGFDADGELFCNQRYGDWPIELDAAVRDPWAKPKWMLLSYGKKTAASSAVLPAANAVDENIQTWWKAADNTPGQWLQVDLGRTADVHAVQINFADDLGTVPLPEGKQPVGEAGRGRYIEQRVQYTRWLLEGSLDGEAWFPLEDKREAATDLPHDLVVREEGVALRYVRLTVAELPYHAVPCVSGLRVFGKAEGSAPQPAAQVQAVRTGPLDMDVTWAGDAVGCEVLWGYAPEKLYHSCRVLGQDHVSIGALAAAEPTYYVRVDTFNESGITEGQAVKVV